MGKKKFNEQFVEAFVELDKLCCEKFGVQMGGVTEYITRLNNAKYAPNRDEVLPVLVKYRNLRNKFAHEPEAFKKADAVAKTDVKWLVDFKKSINKKKDPLTTYLRKARRLVRRRNFGKALLAILGVAAVAAVAFFALNGFAF